MAGCINPHGAATVITPMASAGSNVGSSIQALPWMATSNEAKAMPVA